MDLLDTNVVSELRKARPDGAVVEWIKGVPDQALFLSALTVGELQAGAERTRQQDPEKAVAIESWIDQLAAAYEVIPMDALMFWEWARLVVGQSDQLIEDAMIAATAGFGAEWWRRATFTISSCFGSRSSIRLREHSSLDQVKMAKEAAERVVVGAENRSSAASKESA